MSDADEGLGWDGTSLTVLVAKIFFSLADFDSFGLVTEGWLFCSFLPAEVKVKEGMVRLSDGDRELSRKKLESVRLLESRLCRSGCEC